jgi:quinol-cytochrome oxidoreductase complex cytochrome b subunit
MFVVLTNIPLTLKEKNMFYAIDNHLITICQRLIWRIELFTPLGRKGVAKLIINIHWFFITIFALLSLTTVSAGVSAESFFAIFMLISFCFIHLFVQKTLRTECFLKKPQDGLLPEAVTKRYKNRAILLMSVLMVINTILLAVSGYKEEVDALIYFLAALFPSSICYIVFCEYFLCTTSLPPGEKEKQEAAKMRPSVLGISG